MRHLPILALPLMLTAMPSHSATDDAWAAMRSDIDAKCRALAPPGGTHETEVNPFGSERFGAAIVTSTMQDGSTERAICIYEKQFETAEITAPFSVED